MMAMLHLAQVHHNANLNRLELQLLANQESSGNWVVRDSELIPVSEDMAQTLKEACCCFSVYSIPRIAPYKPSEPLSGKQTLSPPGPLWLLRPTAATHHLINFNSLHKAVSELGQIRKLILYCNLSRLDW